MSFLIYFFVLLVSAASVLFGLDLMSSPLPNTPNVPIGRSVQVVSRPPAQQRQARAADERALTPVYPTRPGKPKLQAETSGAASQEQAKLTPAPAPAAMPAPAVPIAAPVAAPGCSGDGSERRTSATATAGPRHEGSEVGTGPDRAACASWAAYTGAPPRHHGEGGIGGCRS